MDKQKAEKRLQAIEHEAAELRKLIAQPEKERPVERVEVGENYWAVDEWLESIYPTDQKHTSDDFYFYTGNYFRTVKEAEEYAKAQKKKIEILKWIREKNDGWWPDWEDMSQKKYGVRYVCLSDEADWGWTTHSQQQPNAHCLKSGKLAKECIEVFGSDIKCLFI